MVPPTIDTFAAEWEINLDEMRLWVLAHELAGLALFSVDHFADHLRGLVQRHVGAFQPDASAEELVDYWKTRITTRFDSASGLLTYEVEAFSPLETTNCERSWLIG